MNKVVLCGRLGADPESRYTPTGKMVANFPLATNHSYINPEGERQESTEWHRITVWGRLAEVCSQYLSKGRQVLVEGRIQYSKSESSDGETRYFTNIVATSVRFLGSANGHGNTQELDLEAEAIPF
ncbi:MAG TPA: single-stranded DNA-binding protein [Brevefilum sp.]|nr:single-stranded DNA-binding protein [Brevefilum sp.]HPL69102.1 single-stranded DNA-binding protein [Brevefilum sp.]